MARSAKITLDGAEYEIKPFNIGELEKVTEIFETVKPSAVAFEVLKMALAKIDKTPEQIAEICPTMDEISTSFKSVMELAGMSTGDPK